MEFGLYVVMEVVPTEKTLLYLPFHECLMTMKEQTSSAHSVGELLPLLGGEVLALVGGGVALRVVPAAHDLIDVGLLHLGAGRHVFLVTTSRR